MEKIGKLTGLTLSGISGATPGSDIITFEVEGKPAFRMYHDQDCCETVELIDVVGDVGDLVGTPIVEAYESSSDQTQQEDPGPRSKYDDSYTWTFYRLRTTRGTVTLRWYGTSNGYYSESVDFCEVK